MIIKPRTAWQLPKEPVTGPRYNASSIVDVVYHYPGASATASFSNPVAVLRAMQHDYLVNRGYSLGYNFVIDPTGSVWQVRGLDIKSAAVKGYNDQSVTVQFMVPGQAPANKWQVEAAVDVHKWLESLHGRRLGVAGHYQRGTTATPCPGAGIKGQLPLIDKLAHPAPTPPPPITTGGSTVFIARWHEGTQYQVWLTPDGVYHKRKMAANEPQHLAPIAAGAIPYIDDRGLDQWLTQVGD